MKKTLAFILALAMALSLAACGSTEETPEDQETPAQEETAQPEDETAGEEEDAEGGEPADEAEEPADEAPAEEGNTASDPGSAKPAGGQSAPEQKPAEEQKPAQKPQEPAKDEAASQPTQPETPAEPAAESVDLAAFAASVTADQNTWPGMMAMEGEALDSFYAGLSAIATKQCVVQMAMISASGDEIALVEVENSADVRRRHRSRRGMVSRPYGDVEERVPHRLQRKLRDAGGPQRRRQRGGAVQRPVCVSGRP